MTQTEKLIYAAVWGSVYGHARPDCVDSDHAARIATNQASDAIVAFHRLERGSLRGTASGDNLEEFKRGGPVEKTLADLITPDGEWKKEDER